MESGFSYGEIDITINLSKPEKDPKAIAAAKNAKNSSYPKCQLCMENEGYAGRLDHPQEKITGSSLLPSTEGNGDSSIPLMYTTMSIASYLTANISR